MPFSHLKRDPIPSIPTAAQPINSNVYWKLPQRAEIFTSHSINSNNFESSLMLSILFSEYPLLILKRHFVEYILLRRDVGERNEMRKGILKRVETHGYLRFLWSVIAQRSNFVDRHLREYFHCRLLLERKKMNFCMETH